MSRKTNAKRIEAAHQALGDWTFEDEVFTREDWKYEVGNGDTQLGYYDWVIHNLESAE